MRQLPRNDAPQSDRDPAQADWDAVMSDFAATIADLAVASNMVIQHSGSPEPAGERPAEEGSAGVRVAPHPPSSVSLEELREAIPKLDEVILAEVQREREHRLSLEALKRQAETRRSRAHAPAFRRIGAGVIAVNLATVGGGILLAVLGHAWGAGIAISGPVITVIINKARKSDDG